LSHKFPFFILQKRLLFYYENNFFTSDKMQMKSIRVLCPFLIMAVFSGAQELPQRFDLRGIGDDNYVTSVKSQQGGTCWTHAVMASMESNLLRRGNWPEYESDPELDLSEYHLDWWNGFNTFYNRDFGFETEQGLQVHFGGDYRVAAAYLSRGDGAVRDRDGQSFDPAPAFRDSSYRRYYPRRIRWFTLDDSLSNMAVLKRQIMEQGAVGTCMYVGADFPLDTTNGSFYQPPSDPNDPNHAITIVGWDDSLQTPAALPGAWLCKNSWGSSWGAEWNGEGYFWISYYDKHAARHPEMGFVAFQDVEALRYDTVYCHDYHGWRDAMDIREAANVFAATGRDTVKAISFYTLADSVTANIGICGSRAAMLNREYAPSQTEFLEFRGFHTVELDSSWVTVPGDSFFVALHLDRGGQACDRSSTVPVLLDVPYIYSVPLQEGFVPSHAAPGESFYYLNGEWRDLYREDKSANFCIKALATHTVSRAVPDYPEGPYLRGLYPNPLSGTGWLDIDIPQAASLRIEVCDLRGKRVRILSERIYEAGRHGIRIDVSGLSQGLYLCILRYENHAAEALKMIVIR